MIQLKTEQYDKFIKHYAEDENGVKYQIKQNETGVVYDEAVDLVPCRYTYTALTENVEKNIEKSFE